MIETSGYTCQWFEIYVALSPRQQARGLMYVRELPDDQGMLFLYSGARRISMWMKNTLIPLDMLFIRKDGQIANIESDTTPGSLASISAAEPVSAVLELNAGIARKLGIQSGDLVRHEFFANAGD